MADEGWDTILTRILQNQKWFSEEMDPISQSSLLAGALEFSKKPLPQAWGCHWPFWEAFSGRPKCDPDDSLVFSRAALASPEDVLASFLLDELWARASRGHKLSFWEDLMANGLQHPCDLYCRLLLFSLRRGLLPLEENEPVRHWSPGTPSEQFPRCSVLSGLLRWRKKGLDSLTAEKTSNEVAESLGLPEDTMSAFWAQVMYDWEHRKFESIDKMERAGLPLTGCCDVFPSGERLCRLANVFQLFEIPMDVEFPDCSLGPSTSGSQLFASASRFWERISPYLPEERDLAVKERMEVDTLFSKLALYPPLLPAMEDKSAVLLPCLQLHTQLFVRRRWIQALSHSRIEDTAELSWAFSRDVDPSVSIRLQWSGAREQAEAQGEEEDNELTAAPRYNLRSHAQSSGAPESSGDGPVRVLCATGDGCKVVENQPGTLELTPMNKDASVLVVCEREHFLYTLHCILAEEEGK